MKGVLLCTLVCIFGAGHAAAGDNSLIPSSYNLQLFLDTTKNIFSGEVAITTSVKTGGITNFNLHNNGLNISTVSIVQGGANLFSSISTNSTTQTSTIFTTQGLTTGSNVVITISYQGNVSTEPTGLFMFVDKGKTIYMTNLYPIYARKLFPCFDEPNLAAQMSLSLTLVQSWNVIASTPLVSTKDQSNGYKTYTLATTVPIAPYSLFFTLGDWAGNTGYSLGVKNLNIYLAPSLADSTSLLSTNLLYAANSSNIKNMILLSGTSYNVFITPVLSSNSYSGLNTVVLKTDITLNNLYETTTEMSKMNLIAITQAFYRMFYGTWSRPASWRDNWLATSIPLYLAYQHLDKIENQIYGSADENLVTGLYEEVFQTSWAEGSPVPYTSNQLATPNAIISFITSSGVKKGAYVLKSLEMLNSTDTVQSTLLGFLLQTNGSTMETGSFLSYLNTALQNPKIKNILSPMITESGYPLIQLSRNQQTMSLVKSSFAIVSAAKQQNLVDVSNLKSISSWLIPITVATWQSPNTSLTSVYYMDPGTNTIVNLDGTFPNNGWAVLDLDGKGMMRVSYDVISWMLFKSRNIFSPTQRAKLIADAFATAESTTNEDGYAWITIINYLESLDKETDLAPWTAALDGFHRMWSWVYETQNKNLTRSFATFWEARLTNIYNNLTTQGNNDDSRDPLRRLIVNAMCDISGAQCTKDLAQQYQNMVNNNQIPSADMYSVVVCNGLRGISNVDQWNPAFQNYVNSGGWFSQQVLDSHYSFLACPSNDVPINQFLTNVLLNTQAMDFSTDQVVPAVKAIMSRPEHVDQVLSFIVKNQPNLNVSEDIQAEIIENLGGRLSSKNQVQQLQSINITTKGMNPKLVAAVQNAIALGSTKADWVSKIQMYVQKGLDGANPPTPPTTGPTNPTEPTPTGTTSSSGPTTGTPAPKPTSKPGSASVFSSSLALLVLTIGLLKVAQ